MEAQNQEVLRQLLSQMTRMHLDISKAGEFLWQVSLELPEQVKEHQASSIPAGDLSALTSESKGGNLLSNSTDLADINSVSQSSTSSENSSETESSKSSLSSLPDESSTSDATVSESNSIDLLKTSISSSSTKKPKRPSQKEEKRQSLPSVFISYSHDSEEHKKHVRDLVNRLIKNGIKCIFDEYAKINLAEQWSSWMTRRIEEAEFVIVVCTKNYHERLKPRKGKGVTWEGAIIRQELYDKQKRKANKFIPVIFEKKDYNNIPSFIRGFNYYVLNINDNQLYEEQYKDLYRQLTKQPKYQQPEPGPRWDLPPED